jgi:hypothetical protein
MRRTLPGKEVKLKIGEARDIEARRIQTDYKRVSSRQHESEWEITLHNKTAEEIAVGIVEPLFGQWEVLSSSHKYSEPDPYTIRFDVKLPKDEEIKVRYRVSIGW